MVKVMVDKKISAVKARPAKTVKIEKTICDLCDLEAVSTCCLCDRDICYEHKNYDRVEIGDYPDHYCEWCDELKFETYSEEKSKMENRHYEEELALEEKIKAESLRRHK